MSLLDFHPAAVNGRTDEWSTPQDFFDKLNEEFHFDLDAAATAENAKCTWFLTAEDNALECDWSAFKNVFLNPPYSRELLPLFVAKAAQEAAKGPTVVCVLPSRTGTFWFHRFCWDAERHCPRPGVELRFHRGRLKFGGHSNAAAFDSLVVVFWGRREVTATATVSPPEKSDVRMEQEQWCRRALASHFPEDYLSRCYGTEDPATLNDRMLTQLEDRLRCFLPTRKPNPKLAQREGVTT